jgi:DNA-binding MarR family transcriptional regulator
MPAKPKQSLQPKEMLLRRVGLVVRQLGAQSVLSSAVMAKRFGLHPTDLEALDLIFIRKEASAGELGNATGLTSGSVTALIDRLEGKGYVTREVDPNDRRKTLVRINRRATAPIEAAYTPRQSAMFKLWSEYEAEELELVCDFIERSTALLVESTRDRGGPA